MTQTGKYRQLNREEYSELESRILYEDNHLLIINKKCGEIVQGDATGDEPLCESLKAYIAMRDKKPGGVFMGVTHRLDRPVSGVTIFAKTSKALERMNKAFREGAVHKTYWALVCKCPEIPQGELRGWMTRNERQNKSYVWKEQRPGAKLAILRYRLVKPTERYWLVEVELLTGRHHQIRCQLSDMGCPIKGDLKYGAPRSNRNGGISLHSKKIVFMHPIRKEEITVEAPFTLI